MGSLSLVEQRILDLCRERPYQYKKLCEQAGAPDGEVARSLSRLLSLGHLKRMHAWWTVPTNGKMAAPIQSANGNGAAAQKSADARRKHPQATVTKGSRLLRERRRVRRHRHPESPNSTQRLPLSVESVLAFLRDREGLATRKAGVSLE